jgi:hypothetical protein
MNAIEKILNKEIQAFPHLDLVTGSNTWRNIEREV